MENPLNYIKIMNILKMVEEDLNDVSSLAGQLGYPNTLEELKLRFREINQSQDYALFVAKMENGKVAGYIQINREPHTLLSGPRADIAALVVDESDRSKGLGAALLKRAENWANENQLPMIRVRSNLKREDAHRFYKRNFYELKKSWHLFEKQI